jgi:hypothetical protein
MRPIVLVMLRTIVYFSLKMRKPVQKHGAEWVHGSHVQSFNVAFLHGPTSNNCNANDQLPITIRSAYQLFNV